MVNQYTNAMFAIPFTEHVPNLTAKDDILVIKEYLKKTLSCCLEHESLIRV